MTDLEEWRPVVGWEGLYEVSSLGRVKGLPVRAKNGRLLPERLIATPKHSAGYLKVELRHRGAPKQMLVHRMVCMAFHGDLSSTGMDVCHKNAVKDDNRPENLEWGTRSYNALQHAVSGNYRNQNTRKTHCVNGHEFSEENTYINPGRKPGQRVRACKTCGVEAARRYRAKNS